MPRPALWPTQPDIQWLPGFFFLEVNQPGQEVIHLPSTSAEVSNECSCTCICPLCSHSVDMENLTFFYDVLSNMLPPYEHKTSSFPVISAPIYQITLHHSPEDGDHCTHCCDNWNLILHTALSAKLTEILGQFLQAFLFFIQTGNTQQTATWNTVQHLQSQTDDNSSNSTLQFCYLSLTHWLSHDWQLTHGRLVRFRAQIHQAAGFHQECNPHLQLPSWFIFLLPRFTFQLIPSEKHISMLRTESEGFK
jgi:hypothetical protein